jgi:hypothetical protein
MSDRKAGKIAALGMAYGGSKTGHFHMKMGDYWEQAMSRVRRPDPIRYNGNPYLCTRCEKPMVARCVAGSDDNRCICHHAKRQKETKQQAMERRAHWLLKKEFDPDPAWADEAYKVDFAEIEKSMSQHLSDAMLYGWHGVTNNKEKK